MTLPNIVLDHVAVVVPDLAAAAKAYEKLGFRLTAQSAHRGALEPGAPVETWGSGNVCAMFRSGYLELLGIIDPKRYTGRVMPLLSRYAGLHLVSLGVGQAQAAVDLVEDRFGAKVGIRDVGRDVPVGDGTKPARFRIVNLPPDVFPDAQLFFIEHATPDVLWQPELLDQPNGVTGLVGAVLCVADPSATAARLAHLLGADADERRFDLARGFIDVTDPSGLAERYGVQPPTLPFGAAVRYGVADLGKTAAYLRKRGVPFQESPGRIWLDPSLGGGAVVEFVAA